MTVCPFAVWRPVAKHGGRMGAHIGLVLHVQAGNGGLSGWFNNPNAPPASSTWWVSKTGTLEQYVDADLCAWAQGAGNGEYNSVETEGYPDEPLTSAAENMLARLYAWGVTVYRWPLVTSETPGTPGFGWHGMGGQAWGGHTGCPGDLRKNRRPAILAVAGAAASTPAPPTPTPAPPEVHDMIAPPCTFVMSGAQQCFFVDANGRLEHHYQTPGKPWIAEVLGSGWDPDTGLAYDSSTGVAQVWGVMANGKRAQVYWNGKQWVTQPL